MSSAPLATGQFEIESPSPQGTLRDWRGQS
jgi:hypothetical protein